MYARHRVGVIIPYEGRETAEGSLEDTIRAVPSYVDIIYVVDSSRNGSLEHVKTQFAHDTRLRFLTANGSSRGLASLDVAFQQTIEDRVDIATVISSEHEVDPAFLSYLIDPIVWGMADYTSGNRTPRLAVSGHEAPLRVIPSPNYIEISKLSEGSFQRINPFKGFSALSNTAIKQLHQYFSLVGNRRLLALIPCYNEEVSIGSVALKARKYVDEVLVVDDGSTDGTALVAKQAGVTVITHEKNQGKSGSVATGLKYAIEKDFDIIILLDGDGQHDPDEIPIVAKPVLTGEADLSIGSRFIDQTGSIPLYRMAGQKLLNGVTNLNSKVKSTDSQSGYRALNRAAVEGLDITSEGYNLESDMLATLSRKGLKIREVPIRAIYEVPHKHKKNPLSHGYDVLAHIAGEIGYTRPLLMFGIPGVIFCLLGVFAASWAFTRYSVTGQLPFGPSIAGVLFLIMGLLLVTSGLILNSLVVMIKLRR